MGYFTERKFEPKPKIAIVGGGRNVGKTMTALLETLEELEKYKAIGTVEEFAEFKEKQIPKKPIVQGLGQRYCPVCRCGGANHQYCARCGQKLDGEV